MRKTRNLFVLKSATDGLVQSVLPELKFKGLIVLDSKVVTTKDIEQAFYNNKSVVCCNLPEVIEEHYTTIPIIVCNNSYANGDNYINVNTGNIYEQFQKIAEKLDCDIGDHKSNSSGVSNSSNITDCAYCKVLDGYDIYHQRVLYSSKNFFVMPTLGEFICGYLLIIPKQHIMSIAELNSAYVNEFFDVLDDITYILNLTYPNSHLLVWENGTGNSGIGKAKDSVVHAHVHIAPSNLNADEIRKISGFHFQQITTKELPNFGNHSYLLIKDEEKHQWRINDNPDLYIPRQYVRQLLAEESNIPGDQWNWRIHHFSDLMKKTSDDISKTLIHYWDDLPERIKNNTKYLLF